MEHRFLGEICCPKQWKTISTSELTETGYPVYGANGIIGKYKEYNHEKATILVTCRGATCGSVVISKPYSYVNGNAMALDNLDDDICIDYLYFYLIGRGFADVISGSAQPQIIRSTIEKIRIPLCNFEKQKQIASVFSTINGMKLKFELLIEKYDQLVKARFVEMFGDPQINEKGFTKASMGEYLSLLTDFSSNGSYKALDSGVTMYDEPNYAWMVRTTDLESGDMSSIKYIDKKAYELLSKSKIFGGEIIMNKIGSAGKIYIMPKLTMPASLGRNAFMFRYDERINNIFMYYLLTSDYGQREIQQYVRGAVTKTITKDDARSVLIIVPPLELQQQFAGFVQQVDKSKLAVQQSLKKTQLLFDSLMQEYFGEN